MHRSLWGASEPELVLLDGVRPACGGAAHETTTAGAHVSASPDGSTVEPAAEADGGVRATWTDAVGSAGVRVGRVDAWRSHGFASAREYREQYGSDLWRYNARRRRSGRAVVTEEEFAVLLERGGDEVSSISGSDEEEEEEEEEEEGRSDVRAVHGKAEGSQVVCVGKDGVRFAVWRCLLTPDERSRAAKASTGPGLDAASALAALRSLRADDAKPWIVVLSRGGHFAAAVFDPSKFAGGADADERHARHDGKIAGTLDAVPPASAVAHKTFHRYVVRAKAGGRQSTKDGAKSIKSAGSSIRRANERALEEETAELLRSWRTHLSNAALIFVSTSKTDARALFDGKAPPLSKDDARVRRVPFMTGRPTFNEARRVVARLAAVNYRVEAVGSSADRGSIDVVGSSTEEGGRDVDGMTEAQRARLAALNVRAAAAAAAAAEASEPRASRGEGGADTGEGPRPLSKKEKEKLKKARAKERQKEAAAAGGGGGEERTVEPNVAPPPGIDPPTSGSEKAAGGKKPPGGKAAALLAKVNAAASNKRSQAVGKIKNNTRHPSLPAIPSPTPVRSLVVPSRRRVPFTRVLFVLLLPAD